MNNLYPFSVLPAREFDRVYTILNNPVAMKTVTIGTMAYIGSSILHLYNANRPHSILIGRHSSLAGDIHIVVDGNHVYRRSIATGVLYNERPHFHYSQQNNHYQVIIGHDVWIGNGATIVGGVKIENGAIIGTGAVVTKDVPPYAIVVGNPMRIIRYRFDAETIRKLMAIKWWNWHGAKIIANAPKFYEPEQFLAEHYSPELELTQYEKIGGGYGIERYRAENRKVYAFVADFRAPQPLWKRVISGFLKSPEGNSVLLFWLGDGATQADFENLKTFVNSVGLTEGKVIHVLPQKFSPYLLRNSTHFITTREMVTLECLDWLYDTNVKVVSALDDGIFSDEPEVAWKELYSNP